MEYNAETINRNVELVLENTEKLAEVMHKEADCYSTPEEVLAFFDGVVQGIKMILGDKKPAKPSGYECAYDYTRD